MSDPVSTSTEQSAGQSPGEEPRGDRRAADHALAQTLALLSSIVECAPSAMFAKDLQGRYTLMNTRGAKFLGRAQKEIIGKTDAELFPPDVAREFEEGDRQVIETGESFRYNEEDTPDENGAWQYRLVTKGPVLDEAGNIAGVFGITSDLTESMFAEKSMEKSARENEQLARATIALIGSNTEDDVFNVIEEFFSEMVPDAIVIVNQSTTGGQYFRTRRVLGADDSLMMKAANLLGFNVLDRQFPVTEEYRRLFFSNSLVKVDGGFLALAEMEVSRRVSAAIEKLAGIHDTYTIGMRSEGSEYGSIHLFMRSENAEVPAKIIDVFVRQCVLALSSIVRSHEIAEYQETLETLLIEREEHVEHLAVALSSVIDVVSRTVEMRDPYTAGHQRRVSQLAERIARECNMSPSEVEDIRVAALMHDVGKVTVPAEILSKPGRLTPPEFALAKSHAQAGYEIIAAAHMRDPIAEIIYQHHERCDGSGYPRGLDGEHLHPGAKVIMVADVVEAMASHRPYRPAIGMNDAVAEITRGAGTAYDADVAAACAKVIAAGFDFDFKDR